MKKSSLDQTYDKLQMIIDSEHEFSYGFFLIALRMALGRTKQIVAYDLDLDYDDLWRHEEEKMSRRFDQEKNDLLAEYYGIDPLLLEKKFRDWQKSHPAKYNGGNKADK